MNGLYTGPDWTAWIYPAAVLIALIGLAVMSFWPRPPRR